MKWLLLCCFMCTSQLSFAQETYTGTYNWQSKTGASATITIVQSDNKIETDVFAWWNTPSERHGTFSGYGVLQNNRVSISPAAEWEEVDPGKACKVSFLFSNNNLKAGFNDCMPYNLPEDFNGNYTKIANSVKGIYIVTADKSFVYKEMNETARHTAYLVKGDTIQIENIETNSWGYTNYTNQHNHTTSGFLKLGTLQFIRYKP